MQHILDEIEDILRYGRVPRFWFFMDRMRQRAVVNCLMVIGEATKKLPDALRQQHPAIPWREMARMRDRLIHDYSRIKVYTVWNVVKREIPELKKQVLIVLKTL